MKKIVLTITSVILLMCTSPLMKVAYAQQTLKFPDGKLNMKQLTMGTHEYLVYMTSPDGKSLFMPSVWSRTTSIQKIDGKERLVTTQQWMGADTTFNRIVYSISKKEDFAPVYHRTEMRGKIDAFNFVGNQVVGADSVVNNARKDFSISSEKPAFNWELDLEVFQTLPYRIGDTYSIMFHHPGSKSIGYHDYKVIGDEMIPGVVDRSFDCWKLYIEYEAESYATFWVDKKTHLVIKMDEYYRGRKRVKVLLSTNVLNSGN